VRVFHQLGILRIASEFSAGTDMTRFDILIRLRPLASETFGCHPEQLHEATTASDIDHWDSLRHAIFIMAAEREFGIEFDLDAIGDLTKVADLVTLIEQATK
jgi:acyl carrier protein